VAERKRERLPNKIYLEQWNDGTPDAIHYSPVGYGVHFSGGTSRIVAYRRMTPAELKAEKKVKSR